MVEKLCSYQILRYFDVSRPALLYLADNWQLITNKAKYKYIYINLIQIFKTNLGPLTIYNSSDETSTDVCTDPATARNESTIVNEFLLKNKFLLNVARFLIFHVNENTVLIEWLLFNNFILW